MTKYDVHEIDYAQENRLNEILSTQYQLHHYISCPSTQAKDLIISMTSRCVSPLHKKKHHRLNDKRNSFLLHYFFSSKQKCRKYDDMWLSEWWFAPVQLLRTHANEIFSNAYTKIPNARLWYTSIQVICNFFYYFFLLPTNREKKYAQGKRLKVADTQRKGTNFIFRRRCDLGNREIVRETESASNTKPWNDSEVVVTGAFTIYCWLIANLRDVLDGTIVHSFKLRADGADGLAIKHLKLSHTHSHMKRFVFGLCGQGERDRSYPVTRKGTLFMW